MSEIRRNALSLKIKNKESGGGPLTASEFVADSNNADSTDWRSNRNRNFSSYWTAENGTRRMQVIVMSMPI
jgi:hypothetical protein